MKQVIRVFRNKLLFPDVLFLLVQEGTPAEIKESGSVVSILDEEIGVLGYNLYGEESDFEQLPNGYITLTDDVLGLINDFFEKSGLNLLEVDISEKFVVGLVEEVEDHPNSSHLHICKVSVGTEILQIVCGARNVQAGLKVIVACVGAVMPDGKLIKAAKVNGVQSNGMLCSARELQLQDVKAYDGIFELNSDEVVGTLLSEIDWRKYHA